MAARSPLVRWVEYAAVRLVSLAVAPWSMATVRRWGGHLGAVACRIDRFHRELALDNLRRAFPGRREDEHEATVRAMFGHFGSLLLELLRLERLTDRDFDALIEVDGEERVWQAYDRGRGVLFFSGHFGYWEMQGIGQPLRLRPVSVLARPLDNPLVKSEAIAILNGNLAPGGAAIKLAAATPRILPISTLNRAMRARNSSSRAVPSFSSSRSTALVAAVSFS